MSENTASDKRIKLMNDKIDAILFCPIKYGTMSDPVTVVQTGQTYDREALCKWLLGHPTRCPLGEDHKEKVTYTDNISARQLLTDFKGDDAYVKYDDSDFKRQYDTLWLYAEIASLLYGMNHKKIDWMAAQQMVNDYADQKDPIVLGFKSLLLHPDVFENRKLEKNEAEALRLWQENEDLLVSKSRDDDVWAQWLLGMFYDSLQHNDVAAMDMFTKAAKKGHALSQCSLGALYENEGDYEEAGNLYEKAAEQGHALAQYSFAELHDETDFSIKKQLLEDAAAQGHASALYNLGDLYINSDLVPRNREIARKYFESAAEQGHEKAQKELLSMLSQTDSEVWLASHLRIRAEVRKCETMDDFQERIYRDPDYEKSLRNIEQYQLGGTSRNEWSGHWADTLPNRERQCEKWARALKSDEKWASELNDDLRTVRTLLFEVCNRWSEGRLTDQEIISSFNMNILRIVLNSLPMDRANSLFQLTDYCFNTGGKHFFAEEHQALMEETGVIPSTYKGQHTMNRRYLQLVREPKLGLSNLLPWIKPTLSPLIAISDDVRKRAEESGIVIYKSSS